MKSKVTIAMMLLGVAMLGACASAPKQEQPAPAPSAPAPAPVAAPAPEPKPAVASTLPGTYEVVRGDHLWGIAALPRIYGNAHAWPLLYKANRGKIADADQISPGQVLDVPRTIPSAELDAAVRHARTRGAWKLGVTEDSDTQYLSGKR